MGRLWNSLLSPLWMVLVVCVCLSKTEEDCVYGNESVCHCGGRLRLEGSSGVVLNHYKGAEYINGQRCLFFLESNRSMASIRLRINYFDLECLWDYLYVFMGDSVYSSKIAALTGDILAGPAASPPDVTAIPTVQNGTKSTNTTGSATGPNSEDVFISYRAPSDDITIASPGSSLTLYFYTDGGQTALGFNISYWVDYTCPENCSGRGVCNEEGRCVCGEGWTGEVCRVPACPNKCSGHGVCGGDGEVCVCQDGYTGLDCSISVSLPHWETVRYSTTGNLSASQLARALHSAVLWGDHMIIYGGYRFPRSPGGEGSGGGEEEEEEDGKEEDPQLLRYHISTATWEVLLVNSSGVHPDPRYGHSAVVYNDTMYIFGGALIPQEELTRELWALHLPSLSWTFLSPSPSPSPSPPTTTTTNASNNSTVDTEMDAETADWPLAVRSHTAHVVGKRMVVLSGMTTSHKHHLLSIVQEYDFELGEWSVPSQTGAQFTGRASHSSVYDVKSGLIYVYGGRTSSSASQELLVYDPIQHSWSKRASAPYSAYLHSTAILWGSWMVAFAGVSGSTCFSDQLLIYNIACDRWYNESYPGLPGNSRRYGHTITDSAHNSLLVFGGFLGKPFGDVLQLTIGNCSQSVSEEECVSGSVFCVWSNTSSSCLSLEANREGEDLQLPCAPDYCLYLSCMGCMADYNCTWNDTDNMCRSGAEQVNATCPSFSDSSSSSSSSSSPSLSNVDCSQLTGTCEGCLAQGCQWGQQNSLDVCLLPETNSTNFISSTCPPPCSSLSCSACSSSTCLWCPSLNQCSTNLYYLNYPFGQCLGWANKQLCPVDCSSLSTCDTCHSQPECGWCSGPDQTGLGVCMEGGFLAPHKSLSCPNSQWYFEQCPACQCNGHSTCVNESVCEMCENNTAGDHCESCADQYYGNAVAGGNCTECFCNGYNSQCDGSSGICTCHDAGVVGSHCQVCATNDTYQGDASNICFYKMSVGFIYTFGITEPREKESFYLTVPKDNKKLRFTFDIKHNFNDQIVRVQLFLGKKSEDYWVLVNLTGPIEVHGTGSFSHDLDDRAGNRNVSSAQLFSFARPSLANSSNFTKLFSSRTENDYTRKMWNGDVALIVHVSNLTTQLSFKMTLDQTDLWFLLYFFATFVICFTALLTGFLIGWYIKRKIDIRRYMRQQYRELRHRVSRPFARIKLIIQDQVDPSGPLPTQKPAYVSVQSCRSTKAGVLTTFIQLPGDSNTGRPAPGRSALCLGTALVRVSHSKKSKNRLRGKERPGRGRREREEEVVVQVPEESNGTQLRGRRVLESSPSTSMVDSPTQQ